MAMFHFHTQKKQNFPLNSTNKKGPELINLWKHFELFMKQSWTKNTLRNTKQGLLNDNFHKVTKNCFFQEASLSGFPVVCVFYRNGSVLMISINDRRYLATNKSKAGSLAHFL